MLVSYTHIFKYISMLWYFIYIDYIYYYTNETTRERKRLNE